MYITVWAAGVLLSLLSFLSPPRSHIHSNEKRRDTRRKAEARRRRYIMTHIHCLTCTARIEVYGTITALELGAQNNWLPVKIEGIKGYICEGCSKWLNYPLID